MSIIKNKRPRKPQDGTSWSSSTYYQIASPPPFPNKVKLNRLMFFNSTVHIVDKNSFCYLYFLLKVFVLMVFIFMCLASMFTWGFNSKFHFSLLESLLAELVYAMSLIAIRAVIVKYFTVNQS